MTEVTNRAGGVVSTVTSDAKKASDSANAAAAPTLPPVLAGGLLGAGVAAVALL